MFTEYLLCASRTRKTCRMRSLLRDSCSSGVWMQILVYMISVLYLWPAPLAFAFQFSCPSYPTPPLFHCWRHASGPLSLARFLKAIFLKMMSCLPVWSPVSGYILLEVQGCVSFNLTSPWCCEVLAQVRCFVGACAQTCTFSEVEIEKNPETNILKPK